MQLVHVSPEGVWSADQDAALNYTIQEDFMSSTWDWIGLYKVHKKKQQTNRCGGKIPAGEKIQDNVEV